MVLYALNLDPVRKGGVCPFLIAWLKKYIITMKPDELKRWRRRVGCSQAQLARVLAVDVMTISRWAWGAREIASFLHPALGYLELKGVGIKKKERKSKSKGGK